MTTEERLRSLLEAGSPDWQKAERGPIAWMIREHGRGAQIGNVLLEEDVDLAVEAVNALPKLLAVVAAARDIVAEYDKTHLRHDVGYERVADAIDELFGPLAALDTEP